MNFEATVHELLASETPHAVIVTRELAENKEIRTVIEDDPHRIKKVMKLWYLCQEIIGKYGMKNMLTYLPEFSMDGDYLYIQGKFIGKVDIITRSFTCDGDDMIIDPVISGHPVLVVDNGFHVSDYVRTCADCPKFHKHIAALYTTLRDFTI